MEPIIKLNTPLQRIVLIVALLNLAYFGIEALVALRIGSVSLFADSIDFLEDTSINLLILIALGWNASRRALVGKGLAAIILIPGLATLWVLFQKVAQPVPPEAVSLSLTGLGALAINLSCAFLLANYRQHTGSLTKAAFLSARNDAFANIAIIVAGGITAWSLSPWPDMLVGIGIAILNAGAAREVYRAAQAESLSIEDDDD